MQAAARHAASGQSVAGNLNDATRIYNVNGQNNNNAMREGLPPATDNNSYQSPYQQDLSANTEQGNGAVTLDGLWKQSQQLRQQNQQLHLPVSTP